MGIIIRTYEPNDAEGLSTVFNTAFQNLGAGFLRTANRIKWRYPNRPSGDPREIQLAFDSEQNRIIGAVYSTVENYQFDGESYRVGAINDVGVLPEYGGRGIGKKLMELAIEYMEGRNCDFSVLSADQQGFPREKLYVPLGWQDFSRERIWFHVANYQHFIKYVPGILPALPALALARYLRLLKIHKLEKKFLPKGIKIHQYIPSRRVRLPTELSRRLFRFFNDVSPRQMDGFTNIHLKEWIYFREQPIYQDLLPVYVTLSNKGQILGYAAFAKQFIYASKMGLRFPIAFMREILVDHQAGQCQDEIFKMYQLLVGKLGQAAFNSGCVAAVYFISPNNSFLNATLKSLGYVGVSGGVFMVRPMKNHSFPKQPVKPFQFGAAENFGFL